MARRDVSIRWSLLRNLLILVALLSGSILAVTFIFSRDAVRRLSRDLVDRTADRAEAELERFFEPVTTQLLVAGDWAASGLCRCADVESLNALLPPVMERIPQVSSVNTGDGTGRGSLVLRDEDGWRNREVDRAQWGARVRWTQLTRDLVPLDVSWQDLDYDPRTRPWYEGAVDAAGRPGSGIHWTAPYTFHTTKDPGITASVQVEPADGTPFVVAYDVLLKDLSAFTRGLEVSPQGLAFVVDADGRIVGLPKDPRWSDDAAKKAAILKTGAQLELSVVTETVRRGLDRAVDARQPFDFDLEGEVWWGGLRPLALEGGPPLYIGVAVPEDDFLGDVRRERNVILLLTALALAGAMALSMLLARRYSRPLEELAAQSERIRDLDMEPHPFTSSNLAEFTRLRDAQERMRSALDSFARYVPTEVVRDLLERGEAAQIGGRTEDLTILFTDIQDFTTIAEALPPTELTAHMAEYFDVMLRALREHDATIDKLIGDAIVAFWGAPAPVPEHPRRAVEAVLVCRERLDDLNRRWVEEGLPPLPTRFGLATGPIMVGNVGTRSRLHYTVLGDMANLASRLEGANKMYGTQILASQVTVEAAGDGYVWRQVDRVAVKGRTGAVDVFELLGRAGELDAEVERAAGRYEEALAHYQARRFDEALAILKDLEAREGHGVSAQRLLHLCRQFRATPPPEDWDGIDHLAHK